VALSHFHAVVIGAGPAGTGPLVCAHQRGDLTRLLDAGVLFVDRGASMGHGSIGQYGINSDTYADTLLECLDRGDPRVLDQMRTAPITAEIALFKGGAVPLPRAAAFLAELGAALQRILDDHPRSGFSPRTEVTALHQRADGTFRVELQHGGGRSAVTATHVVSAMGARQHRDRTLTSPIAPGVDLSRAPWREKAMLTNDVLSTAGLPALRDRLLAAPNRKVVIIGASHSTTSSTWVLLNRTGVAFGPGDITILHRGPFRIFYPSREAALADGYTDFGDDDLCPLTGRVYRLAGLRLDSRELVKQFLGVGGAAPEPRVRLFPLDRSGRGNAFDLPALLDEAAVVIPAFGYRPTTVPLHDVHGERVALMADAGPAPGATLPPAIEELLSYASAPPLVDGECRVLDAHGAAVPHLYGIGLASGFRVSGALGGEPSFRGQTNGLWLYQNGVGALILDRILA
jgi:hypothetical protein